MVQLQPATWAGLQRLLLVADRRPGGAQARASDNHDGDALFAHFGVPVRYLVAMPVLASTGKSAIIFAKMFINVYGKSIFN
jgi:hypothetical protein